VRQLVVADGGEDDEVAIGDDRRVARVDVELRLELLEREGEVEDVDDPLRQARLAEGVAARAASASGADATLSAVMRPADAAAPPLSAARRVTGATRRSTSSGSLAASAGRIG
jgi:hypothetical protein